jgi:hypothetical protein
MKNQIDAIRRALRHDAIIRDIIGIDENGEIKVYVSVGKPDVVAPYIVLNTIPVNGISGVYGDEYAIEVIPLQISNWGRDPNEAWQLADIVDDAFIHADFEFEPYTHMRTVRTTNAQELPDRDTNLTQVVVQYEVAISR